MDEAFERNIKDNMTEIAIKKNAVMPSPIFRSIFSTVYDK